MFERLIRFAIAHRWLVMLAIAAVAALGVFSYQKLPIDAVPDITNVQVQINTAAPGYSPLEAEQRITYPVETVMAGLPGLEQTRSISRYGLSQVTVIFKDGTDIYFARQLVNERIQEAKDKLPAGIAPAMGPTSTGLGEIYLWTVEADANARKPDGTRYTAADLRELQDWVIRPQLRNVRRDRGQLDRRLREGIPRRAEPGEADVIRADACRRRARAGAQQRQRRRGLHREARRAVSGARAGRRAPSTISPASC